MRAHGTKPCHPVTAALPLLAGAVLIGLLAAAGEIHAADETTDRRQAEADSLAMRTKVVMEMDGEFLRAEAFSPEQVQLFVATRIAAENTVMAERRKQPGSVLLPSMLDKQMDTALTGAFGPEVAKRYRSWANESLGRDMMLKNPTFQANEWLTTDEQQKLARAWGPIVASTMDIGLHPNFKATPQEEKCALFDRLIKEYDAAAEKVLDAGKLAELRKRLGKMREAALQEIQTGSE